MALPCFEGKVRNRLYIISERRFVAVASERYLGHWECFCKPLQYAEVPFAHFC